MRKALKNVSRTIVAVACAGLVFVSCGPEEPEDRTPWVLRLTGEEYRWIATYPGRDGQQGTADDLESLGEIRVPAGRPVTLDLTSRDYLYTLSLPDFGVREIAVPELVFSASIEPMQPGKFRLVGDQLCGFSHPSLMADFIVVRQSEFRGWVARLPRAGKSNIPGG